MPTNLSHAAAALGSKGGKAKSRAKTEAARANAKLPRSKAPRCPCGLMTAKRAETRHHACATKSPRVGREGELT